MDWLRARLILLATFTCLNLFLGYRLWVRDISSPRTLRLVEPNQLQQVKAQLSTLGLHLTGEVPAQTPQLSLLRIQRTTPVFAQALLAEFGQSAIDADRAGDNSSWTRGATSLVRDADGAYTYRSTASSPPGRPVSPQARNARQIAEQFLRSHGGVPDDARFIGTAPLDDERMRVDYVQVWHGVPLLPAGLSLVVSTQGIEQVRWLWYQPLQATGEPKTVLPASEALLRLAGHLGGRTGPPMTVRDIQLGYDAVPPGNARQWDTYPVWRIATEDGGTYSINAITGESEH